MGEGEMSAPEWIEVNIPFGPVFGYGEYEADSLYKRFDGETQGLEVKIQGQRRPHIIGSINRYGGRCGHCQIVGPGDIVTAYRDLYADFRELTK
jgi:hypothetical protein